jgi:hypothetical protein
VTRHERAPTPGTSSADPFLMSTYATDGTAMATTLADKATALGEAAEALTAAGETIAGLADLVTAVADLAADWYHLDEFAGDVAAGFLATLGPDHPHDGSPLVLTIDDGTLDDLGRIGVADRDAAIATAEDLAADYRSILDAVENGDPLVWDPPGSDGAGMSLDTFERLTDRLEQYDEDAAFSVAFAEAMGVYGVVGLRALFRSYAQESRDVGRPHGRTWTDESIDTWVDDRMVGVAGVLHTAMDTRRATTTRADADNAGLGDAARLDDGWVDRFAAYGGESQLDYSLLVREADLPADVLVAVGDNHLGDAFGYDARGSTGGGSGLATPSIDHEAKRTIAAAIAADHEASVGWLASEGISSGTSNLELILTSPAGGQDAFPDVVEAGLTHPTDDGGRGALVEQAVRIVGDPNGGGIPVPLGPDGEDAANDLRQALAGGAAANMDVLQAMIADGWPDAMTGQDPPADAWRTHDFLREVMRDRDAADAVASGYVSHAVERLDRDALPAPGVDTAPDDVLTDRADAFQELGMLEGTIVRAENNALVGSVEERIADQQRRGRSIDAGIDIAAYAGGFVPGYGQVIGSLDAAADIAGVSPGEAIFPTDLADLDEANDQAMASENRAQVNFAILRALADGADPPPIDAADGVSDDEQRQFKDWLLANHYDENAHSQMTNGFAHTRPLDARR